MASTSLNNVPQLISPQSVNLQPDQLVLERILLSQPQYLNYQPAASAASDFARLIDSQTVNLAAKPSLDEDHTPPGNGLEQEMLRDTPASAVAALNTPQTINTPSPSASLAPAPATLDFFTAAPPLQSPPDVIEENRSPISTSSINIAAPLGYQKQAANQQAPGADLLANSASDNHNRSDNQPNQAETDSAQSDQGGDQPADYAPPPRRSFSGTGATANKQNLGFKAKDIDHNNDDLAHTPPSKDSPAGNLKLFGLNLSTKKALLIAVICPLLLYIVFTIFGHATSSLFNMFNETLATKTNSSITGIWRFAAQSNKRICRGVLMMHQRGSEIFGEGKDNILGPFRFTGSLKGNGEIEFNQQHCRGNSDIGKPITYHGAIDSNNSPLFASGDFQTSFRQGYGWRGQVVTFTGPWEAELIKPMTENANSLPTGPDHAIATPSTSGPQGLANKFIIGAIVALGSVIGLFVLCINLFSPDGWRAQRHKEKYIPSQFSKHHSKDLKELSQPLGPGSLPLGQRQEWRFWTPWIQKDLSLPPSARVSNPHILLLGGGEKGKSRLMAKMIAHVGSPGTELEFAL